MKIVFLGAGNVATNLANAFRNAGAEIVAMYNSKSNLAEVYADADVYIYAVRDEVLREVVRQVHVKRSAIHLHTAGSMTLDVFGEDKPHCGVFYPFQTFSKERLVDMSSVPVFIEAKGIDDIAAIYCLAQSVTTHIYEADFAARGKLHLAGVFANNFSNCMYAIANEMLVGTGIPFSVLFPLMQETVDKVKTMSPRKAQTGPAKRRDEAVMQKHKALLQTDNLKQIYQQISDNIAEHEN